MKIKRRHTIGIATFLVIASLACLYVYVNRGIADTTKIQAEEAFTTNELLAKFENKQEKLSSFIEKAIEVEGAIKEITFQDGKYSLILKGDSEITYILCEMQSNQNALVQKLQAGQEVKLKGILKGFLMDVILLHCVLI
jgi:lipopolysaccharide biosynthesis protein